jgi:glycosyltransferase 2 family protein
VSPNVRRWAIHFLRIAVTAVAVVVVVRLIRWDDHWSVNHGNKKVTTHDLAQIREIHRVSQDEVRIDWADGRQTTAVDGRREQGFLTLFDRTNKALFFGTMAAFMLPLCFLAARWWLLLRGQGFPARFGQVFFITYAGIFFNNFLPGAVGGDLSKAILAASGEQRKAAIAGTVILDRLIGLAVMIVLAAVCMTPYVGRFQDRRLVWLVYGLFGAMVTGTLLYFSPPVRRLVAKLPFQKTVAELDGVFRTVGEQKALVAKAAGLSFSAQVGWILLIYVLARAMGVAGAELWMFFIFEPIIFIVTALPISVGGWGVQEYIYKELFSGFGGVDPNQAIALSVLYKLSQIVMSVPGGLLFAMGATRKPAEGGNPVA